MAEPKTRPTDASVADFLAAVEHPRRRADAQVMLQMLTEVSGEEAVMWGPSIVGFGAYQGPTGAWPLIGFSPRKANLVVYIMPGFEARTDLMGRLGKHKTSVACLYLNKLADVDEAALRELCAWSVAAVRERWPAA